jgi:polysaccharide pyruvyl transferase WcaK-like protein
MTVRAFAGAAGVVVRDRESAETLGEWGLRRSVEVAADPAILLSPAPPEQVSKWLWRQGVVLSDDFAVLVPRLVDGYADVQFGAAAMLAKRERQMVLVPFQSADEWLAREIEGQVTNAVVLETPGDPRIAAGLIALSKEVIAIRLHALLFAAAAGVPALGIAYDPKVSRFCDEVGYPHVAGGNLADLENFMNECGCTESTPDAERVHRYRAQAGRAFEILAQILTEKAQR